MGQVEAAYRRALKKGARAGIIQQIMGRSPNPFSSRSDIRKLIGQRLGWADVVTRMKKQLGAIERLGQEVLAEGFKHVVHMGMGGSSLCPETFKLIHGRHPGVRSFDVIDSTDPAAVTAVTRRIDPRKTLFIVASKSGGTVETRSHEAYFMGLLGRHQISDVGRQFVAITDRGSELEKFGRRHKYRKIFLNPSDIGGRYSALSYFGLVPGFFAGAEIRSLIDDAAVMQKLLAEREGETNPALVLGSLIAAAAAEGRDKLTFVASPKTAPLVPWVEQLVAESTGKQARGIIPIDNEPVGEIRHYGKDRLFVFFRMAGERAAEIRKFRDDAEAQGFPIVDIVLGSAHELGRQFLLWEAATAVAGYHLGINPFDEPNVTESKNNTKSILAAFERSGQFPDQTAHGQWGKLGLVAYGGETKYDLADLGNFRRFIGRFLASARPPRYLALLNYFKSDRRTEAALRKIRATVRDRTGMATLRGYGPRFLHSIGQLYKGGPRVGMFVIFVKANYSRQEIPGQIFDFGQLIAAQAIGDSQALLKRKLPTLVVAIEGRPADGLEEFAAGLKAALKQKGTVAHNV
jgi:glucose-6-phosphate isomerase